MHGPFGATPYVPMLVGDLGPLAESFGGLYDLLDELNSREAEADRRERRTGARRALRADVSESAGTRPVVLRESGRLLPPSAARRSPVEEARAAKEALAWLGLR